MRVLLDESLPEPLTGLLTGHAVRTVAGMKWKRLANGELLRRAAADFDPETLHDWPQYCEELAAMAQRWAQTSGPVDPRANTRMEPTRR